MARLRSFKPEDLYLLRTVGDPQLSPDGTLLAYVIGRLDEEADELQSSIWVATVDGSVPPRQFSAGSNDNSPRWSPDGRALLFVGARSDKGASERGGKPQLQLARLDGGEPEELTDAPHGVSQPAWSPDGSRVAYVARVGPEDPDKRAPRVITNLKWRLDGLGVFGERRPHISVLDVASKKSTQITKGDWDDDAPAWSPDGKSIAFISDRRRQRHDEQLRSDLWVVAATGGPARRVTRARGSAAFPAWSPDGKWIAFVGGEHGDEFWSKSAHLMVIKATATNGEPRTLSTGFARLGVPEGPAMQWTASSDALYALFGERGATSIRRFGLDGKQRSFVAGERRIGALTLSTDQRRLAFVATWVGVPSEAYVANVSGAGKASNERMISNANAELRGTVALTTSTRMTSTAPDGTKSESFVVLPASGRKTRLPLVLDIHGGPHGWHPGTFTTTWAITQTLAGAGYAVLMCNPRGSAGYGDEFLAGCVEDWGGGDFDDLMAAVDQAIKDRVADREQLYVWGYSYGGFMTSWVVGHTNRFRAAVVGAPVVDQLSMIGTTDIPQFAAYELGGLPWERPDEYAKRSPLTYAPNIDTPVLLIHQDGDLRCPIGQSDELFAALKLLKKKVEYVRYPGGFHAMGVPPSHLVDRVRRTAEWFARHSQ